MNKRSAEPTDTEASKDAKLEEGHKCSICAKSFEKRSYMLNHQRTMHVAPKKFPCLVEGCRKVLTTSQNRIWHMNAHYGIYRYECEVEGCNEGFSDRRTLDSHQRFHTEEYPYKCTKKECVEKFKTKDELKAHRKAHKRPRPYSCTFENCGQTSISPGKLQIHMASHTKERNFVCLFPECKKDYSQKGDLMRHIQVHLGIKTYECLECGTFFARANQLQDHENTHTGARPYKCGTCGKAFANAGNLHTHVKIHSGDKQFKCEKCNHETSTRTALEAHQYTHAETKNFVCDVVGCERSYKSPHGLSAHKITHSGIKSFKCEHCKYTTFYGSCLKKHIRRHESQKRYPLPCKMQDGGTQAWTDGFIECSIRCKTQLDLDMHIQRNHTDEGISQKLESERKLAEFFDSKDVAYERDWANLIQFQGCNNIEGGHKSARPDFYLPEESARLGCVVIVGNDEFGHRRYPCDFQRLFNICNALEQDPNFRVLPILYIRFNPHFYQKNGVHYDHPLHDSHELLWNTLHSITSVKPGVNLVYVHYDETDDQLNVFLDKENDYSTLYKDCVLLKV